MERSAGFGGGKTFSVKSDFILNPILKHSFKISSFKIDPAKIFFPSSVTSEQFFTVHKWYSVFKQNCSVGFPNVNPTHKIDGAIEKNLLAFPPILYLLYRESASTGVLAVSGKSLGLVVYQ
jgi:hypothetical protein